MLNAIIDNLSRLESLTGYIPSVIQIFISVFWILYIRVSKAKYQASVSLSLFLLLVSITAQLLTFFILAQMFAEYSFMFLGIGILHIVFTKNDDNRF